MKCVRLMTALPYDIAPSAREPGMRALGRMEVAVTPALRPAAVARAAVLREREAEGEDLSAARRARWRMPYSLAVAFMLFIVAFSARDVLDATAFGAQPSALAATTPSRVAVHEVKRLSSPLHIARTPGDATRADAPPVATVATADVTAPRKRRAVKPRR